MKEIIILEFEYQDGDHFDRIYPTVIRDQKHTVLVDCGIPNTLDILEEVLEENNIDPQSLTHVILTHHDQDHIGNLFDLKRKYPKIIVVANESEEPYISGKVKLERLRAAESILETLDKSERDAWKEFISLLKAIKPVKVDKLLKVNEVYDICGGIKVMDTKGHTSGHISLLLKDMDTIIAGDAAFLVDRRLTTAPERFTINMEDALESLEKIKQSDARNIICYHGGLLSRTR